MPGCGGGGGGGGSGVDLNWTITDGTFGTRGYDILSIAYGNGKFVAGGYFDGIACSADGINWIAVTDSAYASGSIRGIAFGVNKFVAVGKGQQGSTIIYSADGISWTAIPPGITNGTTTTFGGRYDSVEIFDIVYGGDKFVAVGGSKMAYSTDGTSWTAIPPGTVNNTTSTFYPDAINRIAYGGGKFVAVGSGGKMAYSSDGISWTAIPSGTANNTTTTFDTTVIKDITYGGGKFVAVGSGGKIAHSTDGVSWISIPPGTINGTTTTFDTDQVNCITYGGGRFVAVGSYSYASYRIKVSYSTNGENWYAATTINTGTHPTEFLSIAYGDNKFITVGYNGFMLFSSDGTNWTFILPGSGLGTTTFGRVGIDEVVYGGDKFLAVGGYGRIAYSSDGINWTAVRENILGVDQIRGLAYGSGKFVATAFYEKIAVSTDAINWTVLDTSTFAGWSGNTIYGITYGGGKFVIWNYGYMAYSDDGENWSASYIYSSNRDFKCITYGGGKFVGIGSDGYSSPLIAYSTDNGASWTLVTDSKFSSGEAIESIIYANGRFIALGDNGKMVSSSDGVTWYLIPNLVFGSQSMNKIAYNDGKFLATRKDGRIAYSDDGLIWTPVNSKPLDTTLINGVAYGNDTFVVVSPYGMAYSTGK